jgi:hypothetical protein
MAIGRAIARPMADAGYLPKEHTSHCLAKAIASEALHLDPAAKRRLNFLLRTDLTRAQAPLDAAACDQLARRANHSNPVQPVE